MAFCRAVTRENKYEFRSEVSLAGLVRAQAKGSLPKFLDLAGQILPQRTKSKPTTSCQSGFDTCAFEYVHAYPKATLS